MINPATSILGMGTAFPAHNIDRATAAKYAAVVSCNDPSQARKLEALYRRSGIQSRGSVLLDSSDDGTPVQSFYPDPESADDRGPTTLARSQQYRQHAPGFACRAAAEALDTSGVRADEITHLITVTCTGFFAPGFDVALIRDLELPRQTQRIQVGFMGCHAAINGLRAADGLIARHRAARVLLCSVELCSLHYQYGYDVERIVSGALFADGAAAMVLGAESTEEACGIVDATGSCLMPDSEQAMTWGIGDHGFEMSLSAEVPGLIASSLESYLVPWLANHGETISSIGGWAVHPGGSRILSAVESALHLSGDALATSRDVLAEHGNMSSATMPVILTRFAAAGIPKPWLMLGFGPGLAVEVALIR